MKKLTILLSSLALSITLAGQTGPERPSTPTAAAQPVPRPLPKIDFEQYTLPNGLQVILHVDRKLPIVHVNEWFHVGSKNERRGRTGFAHLFEHLMFQGSKNAPGEYFTFAEQAGANIREGGVNGTTEQRSHELLRDGAVGQTSSCSSGSSPTGSRRSPTRSPRKSWTTSATSSRTNAAKAWKTSPTAAGFPCSSRTSSPAITRTRGRSSGATRI